LIVRNRKNPIVAYNENVVMLLTQKIPLPIMLGIVTKCSSKWKLIVKIPEMKFFRKEEEFNVYDKFVSSKEKNAREPSWIYHDCNCICFISNDADYGI
jgi:hypothetical protein